MNRDPQTLNQTSANQIQKHIKKVIHRDQAGFIPGSQGCFNITQINKCDTPRQQKDKSHTIIPQM